MNIAKFDQPTFVVASELEESQYPGLPTYEERTAAENPTSFVDVVRPFQDPHGNWRGWAPVVNLTVTRETIDGTQILLCIRKSDDEVHPDVVSTPTLRIYPQALAGFDRAPTKQAEPRLQVFEGYDFGGESFDHDSDFSRPINHFDSLTQMVMAMKLKMGDPLVTEAVRFYSYPEAIRLQVVGAGAERDGEDVLETVAMCNVAVEMREGSDLFPPRTAAHQKIFWSNIEPFGRAWETKDLTHILPPDEVDPFRMCIQGACIASAYQQLHG